MSIFSPKSVESITGKLAKTVVELELHAEEQLVKAELQKAAAAAAQFAHDAHRAEHALAKKVAKNIEALLGA